MIQLYYFKRQIVTLYSRFSDHITGLSFRNSLCYYPEYLCIQKLPEQQQQVITMQILPCKYCVSRYIYITQQHYLQLHSRCSHIYYTHTHMTNLSFAPSQLALHLQAESAWKVETFEIYLFILFFQCVLNVKLTSSRLIS